MPRYLVCLLTPLIRKVTAQNVLRTTLKKGEVTFPIGFTKDSHKTLCNDPQRVQGGAQDSKHEKTYLHIIRCR